MAKDHEQIYIKHLVLRRYLQKLAYKKGWHGGTINYVDAFAGPWQHASEELEDTSPFIAIEELSQAHAELREHGRPQLSIRCLFIEKDRSAWELLSRRLAAVEDLEVKAVHGEFEDQIDTIRRFVSTGDKPFSFVFIDPTGWTGFALDTIAPILRQEPGEVLINFMMKDIHRFIDHDRPEYTDSFNRLFGSEHYQQRWAGLSGLDREDEIVRAYGERVRAAGRFHYVASTTILNPVKDRTHFHLVYGTRRLEGLRVFRNDAERPADRQQSGTRQRLQAEREFDKTHQTLLFPEAPRREYSDELRERYHGQAFARLIAILKERRRIRFEDLEAEALLFPFTGTPDLKNWLVGQRQLGVVSFEGFKPRQRKPKAGNWIVLA